MVIRDVIHGDIIIEEPIIRELIETPEFQRLRNVKQLGLTYLSFPTTEHSRFTHSIGVFYLGQKILSVIEHKTNTNFSEEDKLALKIACLLHDVGHGAFSHTSEEFFGFNHENYSIEIIENEKTKINQVLQKYNPNLINKIVAIIEKKFPNPVLNSILSGTIDVDRMDYLLRDSYFAGVSYGEVDIDRIFNVIDIKDDQIVFHEKGVKAVEDFIMSRYNMFSQVYLNKKGLAYELLVRDILEEIQKLLHNGVMLPNSVDKLIPFFNNCITIEDYLKVDDTTFITLINDLSQLEDNPQTDYVKMLAISFVEKKIVFKKPQTILYSNKIESYDKSIYDHKHPVKIFTTDNRIVNLEEISPLINYVVNNLTISLPSLTFYLHK